MGLSSSALTEDDLLTDTVMQRTVFIDKISKYVA